MRPDDVQTNVIKIQFFFLQKKRFGNLYRSTTLIPTFLRLFKITSSQSHVFYNTLRGSVVQAPPFAAVWRRLAPLLFLKGQSTFCRKRRNSSRILRFSWRAEIGLTKNVYYVTSLQATAWACESSGLVLKRRDALHGVEQRGGSQCAYAKAAALLL